MATPFKEVLNSGKFVVTCEVAGPKGANVEKTLHHIDLLKDKVDGMNATDNQSANMRFPSLGVCMLIKERGGEPILQMTCRDRNRLALEADLLLAYSRGITNVLCLTGDAITNGDHKQAKPVFDIDSLQLLRAIRNMEAGKDLGGNDLVDGSPKFCAGAIVTPEAQPIGPQLIKFRKKVAAGAEFFQTQAVYDMGNLRTFMQGARPLKTKILAGIVLLTSAGMARFMNANLPGIFVPKTLIDEMAGATKGQALQKGIEIAGRMIKTIKDEKLCDGVHIMAIGREGLVPDILAAAGM